MREAYDNRPTKTVATKVIITFLSLILILNNFIFNSMNYLQIMGCAMGTNCTPPYANMLHNLKHIPTSNISQYYTYDISMIYL